MEITEPVKQKKKRLKTNEQSKRPVGHIQEKQHIYCESPKKRRENDANNI